MAVNEGVSLTAAELRAALGLADDAAGNAEATRLRALCLPLVNVEGAESAPEAVANEALTRTAAYLEDRTTPTAKLSRLTIDDLDLQFRQSAASAVRLSGARALLAPFKPRGRI